MLRCVFIWICLVLFGSTTFAQESQLQLDSTLLHVRVLASNLEIPWGFKFGPDGWIWFTERNGDVHRLQPETGELQLLHQEQEVYQSTDNSGMYALELHPDFPKVPYIYINYTYALYRARLVRYSYDQQRGVLYDSLHILPSFDAHESHNGARILFTEDEKLLVALGDAYMAGTAQDLDRITGKILRINPDGSIPDDNPIPGTMIYSLGHRNVQGLVITPQGWVFASEHGAGTDDEVNRIYPGRNYGWPVVQGYCNLASEKAFCDSNDVVEPLRTWTPAWAPGGLAYYDHPAIPEWRNSLLQVFLKASDGALYGQRMEVLRLDESGEEIVGVKEYFRLTYGRLRSVLVAPDGRVFITTSNRETNGSQVVQADDDKIIEIRNPDFPIFYPGTPAYLTAGLTTFPNPVVDEVMIHFPLEEGLVSVDVRDLRGRLVHQEILELRGFSYLMPRGEIQQGVYTISATMPSGEVIHGKLVFE